MVRARPELLAQRSEVTGELVLKDPDHHLRETSGGHAASLIPAVEVFALERPISIDEPSTLALSIPSAGTVISSTSYIPNR